MQTKANTILVALLLCVLFLINSCATSVEKQNAETIKNIEQPQRVDEALGALRENQEAEGLDSISPQNTFGLQAREGFNQDALDALS